MVYYILKIYYGDENIEIKIFSDEELQDIYKQLKNNKFLEIHKSQFGDTGLFAAANHKKCDMILINVNSITKIELTDIE